MIIERGRVLSVDDTVARVVCSRQVGCARCARGEGCGGGLLSLMLGDRLHDVEVTADNHVLQVGETVEIGLAEHVLLAAAFVVYIVPLLLLIVFAIAGASLDSGSSELYSIIFGGLGLALGFVWVRLYSVRRRRVFRPAVIRQLGDQCVAANNSSA